VGTPGALGFGLGVLVMRRAVAPVAQLAKVVADIDLDQLSAEDHKRIESSRFGDDEVIAVNNLVRNAFEHTLDGQGPIAIHINERELLVTNRVSWDADERHTPTRAPPPLGYGLGLGIVQRLCERNGWSFSLHADEARIATRLSW
jgi:signal transduction histidine kinase